MIRFVIYAATGDPSSIFGIPQIVLETNKELDENGIICFTECKYQEAFTSAADSDKYLPAYDVVSDSCNNVVLFPVDLFDFDSLEVEQYLTAPRENGSVT